MLLIGWVGLHEHTSLGLDIPPYEPKVMKQQNMGYMLNRIKEQQLAKTQHSAFTAGQEPEQQAQLALPGCSSFLTGIWQHHSNNLG